MANSNKIIGGIIPMWVIWVVAIGVIGGVIWYIFIRKPDYAKDTIVEGGENFNPGPYTDKLKDDLIGISFGHDINLHNEILAMTNGRLHAIYDDWKRRYEGASDGSFLGGKIESLPKTIAGDYGTDFSTIKDVYAQRFNQLNLV